MKRAMVVLLAGVMTLGLAACGNGGNSEQGGDLEEGTAETYTISFNLNNGNTTDMPIYQFMGGDLSGMLNYEGRLYTDITLELNDDGNYELKSDVYTSTNGERIEVGASDGIGIVCVVSAEGTYEDNGDGTVTTSAATHAAFDLETDVYSQEIVSAANLAVVEGETSGEYDSDDYANLLEWVPETIFTLGEDGDIVTYALADGAAAASDETAAEEETDAAATTATELIAIPSDDGATSFTLYDDGSYRFYFESYQVEDLGTYTYDAATSTLTITDANGTETVSTADGDNVVFHYVYSQSEDLTGDFTVAAADLTAVLS